MLLRLILHLYRGFAPVMLVLSLPGLLHTDFLNFLDFLPLKVLGYILVYLFYTRTKSDSLVYYYNLNLSKARLWVYVFGLDLGLYLILYLIIATLGHTG